MSRYDCKCEAQIHSVGWKQRYRNWTNPPKDLSERKNATNEMLRNHLELEHWKKEHLIQVAFHNVLITDPILFGGEIQQENRIKNIQKVQ